MVAVIWLSISLTVAFRFVNIFLLCIVYYILHAYIHTYIRTNDTYMRTRMNSFISIRWNVCFIFATLSTHVYSAIFVVFWFTAEMMSSSDGKASAKWGEWDGGCTVHNGVLWASSVGTASPPRPRKHFNAFWGKEMCLVITMFCSFCGNPNFIWSFWNKMDVSSD